MAWIIVWVMVMKAAWLAPMQAAPMRAVGTFVENARTTDDRPLRMPAFSRRRPRVDSLRVPATSTTETNAPAPTPIIMRLTPAASAPSLCVDSTGSRDSNDMVRVQWSSASIMTVKSAGVRYMYIAHLRGCR